MRHLDLLNLNQFESFFMQCVAIHNIQYYKSVEFLIFTAFCTEELHGADIKDKFWQ